MSISVGNPHNTMAQQEIISNKHMVSFNSTHVANLMNISITYCHTIFLYIVYTFIVKLLW